MTEVSVLDQIRKLVELQKIDAQIYAFKKDLTEKPAYLEELKKQFENMKGQLKALEEKFKAVFLSRKSLEGDLKSQDDAIAKANAQLSLLKTNKEYTAKITEIEGIKANKSIVEEKILLSYDEADGIQAQIDKEKVVVAEEEKKYLAAKKEVEDTVKELEEKKWVLESQKSQLIPDLEKSLLSKYERILANKEGLAIVPVQGSVCGGCFMNVPEQVVNSMQMHDQLIYCEMCARILYLDVDIKKV